MRRSYLISRLAEPGIGSARLLRRWFCPRLAPALLSAIVLAGCSTTKYVPGGMYLLDKVSIVSDGGKDIDNDHLKNFISQEGNSRWFASVKVPLLTYSLSGGDNTKWINRALRSMGEPPVIYDSTAARRSISALLDEMRNLGYIGARVSLYSQKRGKHLSACYIVHPGAPYRIRHISREIEDPALGNMLGVTSGSLLKDGMPFNIYTLEAERNRIVTLLRNEGYYHFHKDYITYLADSIEGTRDIDVTMIISGGVHPVYHLRSVVLRQLDDSVNYLRPALVRSCCLVYPGHLFRQKDLQDTYNRFANLGAVKYTNISFNEEGDSLDCLIRLRTNKRSTISFEPEGTNTAGNWGAAATLAYTNRNMFHGSETFSVELRGAYEAITNLEGYTNQDYIEYSVETKLQYPRYSMPFLRRSDRRRLNVAGELSLLWNLENRPEFHRRALTAAWRYKWNFAGYRSQYQFNFFDVSLVSMPWISETFRILYLDNATTRNAILKYNYEDLFIFQTLFGYSYTAPSLSLRFNIATAGNALQLASAITRASRNDDGNYKIAGIAFAQYARSTFEYTYNIRITESQSLVLHTDMGIAYPYGNSRILPFDKRFFSGGANSVRGWNVRQLGPGGYKRVNGAIDIINQTGDVKLDLNMEYRSSLFWKFSGAAFIDAGNIWTLRKYDEQPDGQLTPASLINRMAVSYGAGLRLNFDYFILRFDFGMKGINPAYDNAREHFPICHQSLKRDLTFHFAVGLPF